MSDKRLNSKYKGSRVGAKGWREVQVVPNTITAREFFDQFVVKRKPVIIDGHLSDPQWSAHKWTNEYLNEMAGEAQVQVEERSSSSARFGTTAPKISMKFGELIKHLEQGEDRYYLTTQPIEDGEFEPEELFAAPITQLQHDLPLRPSLFGHLVPYQLNLWMGNSTSGSSSGLHHDFHDNLYVLMRGVKRFTLFSPADVDKLYTRGRVAMVHPNGLINYQSSLTRADGSNEEAVAMMEQTEAELELQQAEEALNQLQDSTDTHEIQLARDRVALAESNLEEIMDRFLEYQEDENDDEDEDDADSFDELDEDQPTKRQSKTSTSNTNDDDDDDDDDDELDEDQPTKRQSKTSTSNTNDDDDDDDDDDDNDDGRYAHFSNIDSELLRNNISKSLKDIVTSRYPLLRQAQKLECTIKAGQMLYLPASWFHEVTSISANNNETNTIGHMALNYWVYPPDGDQFDSPYTNTYWQKRWKLKHPELNTTATTTTTTPPTTSTSSSINNKRKRTSSTTETTTIKSNKRRKDK